MRETLCTTEEAQDKCFPSLSAVTESPVSPAHRHILHFAVSCWCLHWAKQKLASNNCVCAAGWERVQRLCGALQMYRQVDVHVLSPMAHRKAAAVPQSKRRRKRVMPACGVQAGEVQWELFNLPPGMCSQLLLLMHSVTKWHSQEEIKPTQSVCVCLTLLNGKAWELFSFYFVLGKFNVILYKENKSLGTQISRRLWSIR